MKKVKVSVIVPVYNVEKYIARCLDSLVNQTLKEIEIIVVNDGTKDNSQEIVDKYVKKYPEKVVSYIKENGGLSSARNYGIKKATGEYIGFVDSDDYVDLNLFKEMYDEAIKNNCEVVGCQVKYVYADRESYNKIDDSIFNKLVVESPNILLQLQSYAWNKIYKRKFWLDNKFLFPKQYYEDSALVYNILLKAKNVGVTLNGFYHYNKVNETSITNMTDGRAYDIFKSCDSILSFYRKNKSYDKIKTAIDAIIIGHIRFRIRPYMVSCQFKKLKEYIDYSHDYLDRNIPGWRKNYFNKVNYDKNIHNKIQCLVFKSNIMFYVYAVLQKTRSILIKR